MYEKMGLPTKTIKKMKEEGYSFDEIQEISKRLEQYKSGNLETLNQDEFWKEVYAEMNVKIKQYHNA